MARLRIAITLPGLCLLLGAPPHATAQMWLPVDAERTTLRLDVAKPLFDVGPFRDAHFATTVWDATLVVPMDGIPTLFAQLGLSIGEIAGSGGWNATLSKPRIGAILGRDRGIHGELHADLPLAREMGGGFATGVGRYTNFEEWERFGPDSWSVGGSVTAEAELSPATFLGTRFGGTLLLPTEAGVDNDGFAVFTFFGEAPNGRARFLFELSGIALLTRHDLNFSERTSFFAVGSVSLPIDVLAPEAYVRVPIDDSVSAFISFILGMRIHLGGPRARG
jgi:hypothetical protein